MGATSWVLAVSTGRGLVRIPEPRYREFLGGTDTLPVASQGIARVMEIFVVLFDRRPVSVYHCSYPQFRVTPEGQRDPSDIESEQQAARGVIEGLATGGSARSNLLAFGPNLARRRLATEHTWRPSQEVLHMACQYINAKAHAVIVAPTTSGLSTV